MELYCSMHLLIIPFSGSRNGLSLVLNIESYEYMAGPNNEAGVKLYLHKPGQLPLVRDLGFALAPGMHFLVDIDNTQVRSCRNISTIIHGHETNIFSFL